MCKIENKIKSAKWSARVSSAQSPNFYRTHTASTSRQAEKAFSVTRSMTKGSKRDVRPQEAKALMINANVKVNRKSTSPDKDVSSPVASESNRCKTAFDKPKIALEATTPPQLFVHNRNRSVVYSKNFKPASKNK